MAEVCEFCGENFWSESRRIRAFLGAILINDHCFCGVYEFLKLQGSEVGSEKLYVGFCGVAGGVL